MSPPRMRSIDCMRSCVACYVFFFLLFSMKIYGVVRIPLENRFHKVVDQVREQRKQEVGPKSFDVSLFGNLAETRAYYTSITTSGQTFSVLLDITAVSLSIPDNRCHIFENPTDEKSLGPCVTANSLFIPSESASIMKCQSGCTICQDSACWFDVSYPDGAYIRGPLVRDYVSLDGVETSMLFGTIERESPNFSFSSCGGILGFAFDLEADMDTGDSYLSNLVKEGKVEEDIFSLCFGEEAGELYLGGYDPNLDAGPIHYVDMTPPYDYYRIPLTGLTLGRDALTVTMSSALLASSTAFIELTPNMWNEFVTSFQHNYSHVAFVTSSINIFSGACFANLQLDDYPVLTFTISSTISIILPPSEYFVSGIGISGEECKLLGVSNSGVPDNIFGITFMQSYNIIFNRGEKSIGFAELRNCADISYISSITEGNDLYVDVGESFELKVAVKYLITHNPVVGIIVEFLVERGEANFKHTGRATDTSGIATLDATVITNGTTSITALVPGSLTSLLEFTIHGEGDILEEYSFYYFYSAWERENTNFLFGIPTWFILSVAGVSILLLVIFLFTSIFVAVRNCRDDRYEYKALEINSESESESEDESIYLDPLISGEGLLEDDFSL